MLESLLVLACFGGTGQSCATSGEAWTKYYGYDKVIERYGKEHPIAAHIVGAIGLAKEKRVYFKVHGPWDLELSEAKNVAWFKKEF